MKEGLFYVLSVKMMHSIERGLYGNAYELLKEIEDELMMKLSEEEPIQNERCIIKHNEQ